MARLARVPLVRPLMLLAIRLFVARHRVGVAVVAFDDGGRILMLRHVLHPEVPWGLPGGWMASGEAPAECALRELWEETGLRADLGPVVHVSRDDRPPQIIMAYLARIRPGPMSLGSEIFESAWYHPDRLPEPLKPYVSKAIKAAMRFRPIWFTTEIGAYE